MNPDARTLTYRLFCTGTDSHKATGCGAFEVQVSEDGQRVFGIKANGRPWSATGVRGGWTYKIKCRRCPIAPKILDANLASALVAISNEIGVFSLDISKYRLDF